MNVYNMQESAGRQPFFHISASTADTAQVEVIKEGHFALAFLEQDGTSSELNALLPFIVDPTIVFDQDTEMSSPSSFWMSSMEELLQQPQTTTSRTPCSFASAVLEIPPGGKVTLTSVYGHADSLEAYSSSIRDKLRVRGFAKGKRAAAKAAIQSITKQVATRTSFSLLDRYTEQSYLDNALRGGFPLLLGSPTDPKVYHVYSRIHGDLERDYNNFQLEDTFFSQGLAAPSTVIFDDVLGPGNFRDVNQNRRIDTLINPFVGDFNVKMFLSFVQADGFNPGAIASTIFKVRKDRLPLLIGDLFVDKAPEMKKLLSKPFRIGSLLKDMKSADIKTFIPLDEFIKKVAVAADQSSAGIFNQNGYWADHWTYTLDLVESYLAVFPDLEEQLLFGQPDIPFYMSPGIMRSRADRYLAYKAKPNSTTVVRVYFAISLPDNLDYPKTRKALLEKIKLDEDYFSDASGANNLWQRTEDGKSIFLVNAITKLSMLGIIKFSSLDQSGLGVEMEGGKPGWNDAMNGLPGILGSGMPETFEMLRLLLFVKASITKYSQEVSFPIEFADFMDAIRAALEAWEQDSSASAETTYWDATNTAREAYRAAVNTTFSGKTKDVPVGEMLDLLQMMEEKVRNGIKRAIDTTNYGFSPSYFYHEVTKFSVYNWSYNTEQLMAKPLEFKIHTVPMFLEGPTRQLKVLSTVEERREVYNAVKNSPLYDAALKMYFICESLSTMGSDVGRMKAFAPGWLENQSIWVHMSYKFYLELIRGGLYDEFFDEVTTGLVPFMSVDKYGRSPIEASSFIVSSVFPDKRLHGNGFVARLSGSTAEYLSMWSIMMAGHKPFTQEKGILCLNLSPILPGWLFTSENTVSFTFLGLTNVTYHNPLRLDTWKMRPRSATLTSVMGEHTAVVDPTCIPADLALRVRRGEMKAIDYYYF